MQSSPTPPLQLHYTDFRDVLIKDFKILVIKSDHKIASVMTEYEERLRLHSTYTINRTGVIKVKACSGMEQNLTKVTWQQIILAGNAEQKCLLKPVCFIGTCNKS